jgi:glycosyltransferase involved in cell wall biosynthesis
MQKTDFDFEILIHDDASTDKTSDIIREYAELYPDKIKGIYQSENKYSKGIKIFATYLYPQSRGKYIAMCEGDDYWTDEYKLQRQVDFLEANEDYSAIGENGTILNTIENKTYPFSKSKERDFVASDFIKKRRIPTASVVFRSLAVKDIKMNMDTYLFCFLSTKGKFKYLPNISSVYRVGMQGVTRQKAIFNEKNLLEYNDALYKLCVPDYASSHTLKTVRAFIFLGAFVRGVKSKDSDKKIFRYLKSSFQCGFSPFANAVLRYIKDFLLYRFFKLFGIRYSAIR